MAIVIDANMHMFADRLNISAHRMIQDYGLATVDEIIEKEAERGNSRAVSYAKEYYHSPEKLIKLFKLTDVENKFVLINKMDNRTREKVLPLLDKDDLVMGLYFFTQDKLLEMLMFTNIEELVRVVLEAFPFEQIIKMFTEDDLAQFFMHDDLERADVMKQLTSLPPEVMQKFVEGVTGQEATESSKAELFNNISKMPDDKFKKFMASIDPDVQRQLTYQITKENPKYLTLFPNITYCNMLNTLMKQDMVKPMIMLNKDTLVDMITELPRELMSIVGAQIDAKELAKFLQKGHMDLIEEAWMI